MKTFNIAFSLFLMHSGVSFSQTDCNSVEMCRKVITEQNKRIAELEKKVGGNKVEPKVAPEWKLVGSGGMTKFVYISPQGLKDKQYLAQILNQVAKNTRIVEVNFFDSLKYTPSSFPMTDSQMQHLKARYNFNSNTGLDRFVFISNGKETSAKIRPGYAE